MSLVAEKRLSARDMPDIDIALAIPGGDRVAIRGPGNRQDPVYLLGTAVVEERRWSECAIIAIRDLGRLVGSDGDNKVTVWRPGQRGDLVRSMPTIVKDLVARVKVFAMLHGGPIAQRAIIGTRSYAGIIRLPAHTEYPGGVSQKRKRQRGSAGVPDLDALIVAAGRD